MVFLNRQQRVVIITVATVAVVITALILFSPSQPSKDPETIVLTAEWVTVQPQDYRVNINSYGRAQPQVISQLIAQVSGRIESVSPHFRPGAYFDKGELLVQIEDDDYRHNVEVAKSQVYRARSALSLEKARAEQARRDWSLVGREREATPLTLRQPQLDSARAELAAMEAQLKTAELNLARTQISVPFKGRVRSQRVDVGQVVLTGTTLAEVQNVEYMEIRLPIMYRDIAWLPDFHDTIDDRPGDADNAATQSDDFEGSFQNVSVELRSTASTRRLWQGKLLRAEPGLDTRNYQHYLVALIEPDSEGRLPLENQYFDAVIDGNIIPNALVIPGKALYQDRQAWTLDDNQRLQKRVIEVLWRNERDVVVASGLSPLDRVVTTRLDFALEGMPIERPKQP